MSALDRLLAPGRVLLAELRAEPARIAEYGYENDDRNRTRRARVLLAMQLDPLPEDIGLARALLAAEVEGHRAAADYQGLAEMLKLASALVARARDPEDVWLQSRAKHASFDTFCGFDGEAMFAAGVAATMAYVRGAEHPERERVLANLSERAADFDEADIAAWHTRGAEHWSADPAALSRVEQVELAGAFEDFALVSEMLDAFERECARTDEDLGFLYHQRRWNRELDAAARIARERVTRVHEPWDRVSRLRDLGKLEAQLGRRDACVAVLAELDAPVAALERDHDYWPRIGLGHMLLELALDIWDLLGPDAATPAEAWVRRLLKSGAEPPPVLIERLDRRGIRVEAPSPPQGE